MAGGSAKKSFREDREVRIRRGFVGRFALYAVILFSVFLVVGDQDLAPLLEAYSVASAALLRFVGLPVERAGTVLSLGDFSVNVEGQCSAMFEIGLLVAATLAYPARGLQRLRGILVGISILLVVNLIRIASLVVIGSVDTEWFTWAHLYVWQGLLVATVAAVWLAWIGQIREVGSG